MLQELNSLILEYNPNFTTCSTIEQGNIFGKWFLEKIDENELSEEDISNAILGKAGDRGIDGFYYNEGKETLFLYQFKYKGNGALSETEVADFKTLAATLGFNNYTRSTWLDSNKGYLDGALIEVISKKPRLYFVYVSSIDDTRAKNIEDSCLDMINKSDFIDEIKFYSAKELVKIFKNDSGLKSIKLIDEETKQKNLFEYSSKNGEIEAIVKNISGYDLVKQFSDESSFEANVRIYVGDKGINKKMRETASEEPDMFWFYNNGITIICRELTFKQGNYELKGAQVVNGAQTINSLKKLRTSEEKLKNIRVLAKILKIPEKDESIFRKIVEFNNKQNKIDNWQFQSNKPFWKQLRMALLEKSGNSLDLIYKVGLPKRDGAKEIKLKEFVLVNIAYSGHPYLAKQGQAAVFKNVDDENEKNSYYYQIFPKEKLEIENVNEITPAEIDRYYYVLLIYLDPNKYLDKVIQLKLGEKEKSIRIQGIDTVMKHSKYYLLYILKKCRPKDTDEITFLKQINDNLPAFFTECVESIFIPIWEEEIRNDRTLISNAPKFTKNQKLLEKIDDKFKRGKFDITKVLRAEKSQLI